MSRIAVLSALTVLLGAAPALAQPSSGAPGPVPRNITATGVTKPPSGGGAAKAPYTRASTEADMAKAQRAAAARDKAWDTKMRTTMGSICKGC
ncbi:hypothetical protein [Methylobacterium goesingense]|uniref:Uncharacterized protein n=1 Tax=Methylobacterium goesingense TaxID=243690 RepID=A0ABV2L278_9HYPH|nr:hypothetical protein [Methylobacterium goesingense]GJD74633.1 hypothetical protein CFIICLFH_2867 [Methylobacterium goesingense]